MKPTNQPPPTKYIALFVLAVAFCGAVFVYALPPLEAPEPEYHTIIWHSRPDLLHLSGRYRVLIYNESGEYIGYLHLSRTEMAKPLRIITDYQFNQTNTEYVNE